MVWYKITLFNKLGWPVQHWKAGWSLGTRLDLDLVPAECLGNDRQRSGWRWDGASIPSGKLSMLSASCWTTHTTIFPPCSPLVAFGLHRFDFLRAQEAPQLSPRPSSTWTELRSRRRDGAWWFAWSGARTDWIASSYVPWTKSWMLLRGTHVYMINFYMAIICTSSINFCA